MKPNKQSHWAVRNINGTSDNKCKCKSWLAHWKLGTNKKGFIPCSVYGCSRRAEVGAHVLVTDGRSNWQWWIAPFCKKHNHKSNTDEMYLKIGVELISANVQNTCQRGDWWEAI